MRFTRLSVFLVAVMATACTAGTPTGPTPMQTQSFGFSAPTSIGMGFGSPMGLGGLGGFGGFGSFGTGPSLAGITPGPGTAGSLGSSVGPMNPLGSYGPGAVGMPTGGPALI